MRLVSNILFLKQFKDFQHQVVECAQTEQVTSATWGSAWSLAPCDAPKMLIDPVMSEQFGEQWKRKHILQDPEPWMGDQYAAESSQSREEDDSQWAIMTVVEDAFPLPCIPDSSDEIIPFDKVVGGRTGRGKWQNKFAEASESVPIREG